REQDGADQEARRGGVRERSFDRRRVHQRGAAALPGLRLDAEHRAEHRRLRFASKTQSMTPSRREKPPLAPPHDPPEALLEASITAHDLTRFEAKDLAAEEARRDRVHPPEEELFHAGRPAIGGGARADRPERRASVAREPAAEDDRRAPHAGYVDRRQ